MKGAAKDVVEEGAEQATKQLVKGAVKDAAKEGAGEIAEQVAKDAVKDVAEEGAEQVAKQIAKKGAGEIAEQAGKKITTETVETIVENTTKRSLKNRLARMGLSVAGAYEAANVDGSDAYRIIENTKENGFGGAMLTEAKRAASDVVDKTTTLVDDITDTRGGLIMGVVADRWPAFAKLINTTRAAVYATNSELKQTMPGSYAVAAFEAAKEKASAWFLESDYKYEGKSLGDIAKQFKENSQEFADTWQGAYKKRVLHLDEELGLDSLDRKFMMGNDEPVLA